MKAQVMLVNGPQPPLQLLVRDMSHTGRHRPTDIGSVRSNDGLRDGKDSLIDGLCWPEAARGVPLLAAPSARSCGMNAVSGALAAGAVGVERADVVPGNRDGTSRAPAFTSFVRKAAHV